MKKQTAGDILVAAVLDDLRAQHMEPDARETELLERARVARDRIAELEEIVALEGPRSTATRTARCGRLRCWPRSVPPRWY